MERMKATPARSSGTKNHAVVPPPEVTEQKGDLLIHDYWQQGTDSVHAMQVVNTEVQYHRTKDPDRCLQEA